MAKINAYLAGPIHHAAEPTRWREDVKSACNYGNIVFVDPMDRYDEPFSVVSAPSDDPTEFTPAEIVEADVRLLRGCDALFVHWPDEQTRSAGTAMEIAYAHRGFHIPIVVWYEGTKADLSPWITYHASRIYRSPRDAIDALLEVVDE